MRKRNENEITGVKTLKFPTRQLGNTWTIGSDAYGNNRWHVTGSSGDYSLAATTALQIFPDTDAITNVFITEKKISFGGVVLGAGATLAFFSTMAAFGIFVFAILFIIYKKRERAMGEPGNQRKAHESVSLIDPNLLGNNPRKSKPMSKILNFHSNRIAAEMRSDDTQTDTRV